MPKYNLDDDSLFEPVTFTIDGKVYTVKEFTHKEFAEIGDLDSIAEQFARFTGIKVSEAEKISYRKLASAISLVLTAVTGGMRDVANKLKKKELNHMPTK